MVGRAKEEDMTVTVEMSSEEFEEFCAYQKDRNRLFEKLSREYSQGFNSLKRQHCALCNLVLNGLNVIPEGIEVVDSSSALRARELAEDYFA